MKIILNIEVLLKDESNIQYNRIKSIIESAPDLLFTRILKYQQDQQQQQQSLHHDEFKMILDSNVFNDQLSKDVKEIKVFTSSSNSLIDYKGGLETIEVKKLVHIYKLSNEESVEEDGDTEEEASPYQILVLPNIQLNTLWENLIYDDGIKQKILNYMSTLVLFSKSNIDDNIISHNRIILLNGPPGTGKTSLCKALAQKLSIQYNHLFQQSILFEINSHSLFSKWFSESGKLVMKVFEKIREQAEDKDTLVVVLIDEVESLTAARKSALSGSEPSDSIRVVNAFLTQLDRLKSFPNILILTTSNLMGAVDVAFIDRVDIKQFIGPPKEFARFIIIKSCIDELIKKNLIKQDSNNKKLK
ncbi:AAA ATPase domain-containing protein [Cavenderia fasciculata]|uniref:AAA ATPase domain-containing protein n=1 Tax=Cavenderia fasciculata TaxID=261658 RepID=F4Q926_CACFS|nr:AAA ATPase domain-containing protein [Cavenderia fasciculata]EGG15195.1 AAA ATPase domain-containing protein [Cavenderia fasciculata]|eukprot:XP_004351915.1 AAA ATPase domain-containing protein [Cavenderia fasciculata]